MRLDALALCLKIYLMKRTQIQVPDALYQQAQAVAEVREISMAELVRRGLEYMVQITPQPQRTGDWELPKAANLGARNVFNEADWRERIHLERVEIAEEAGGYGNDA
jgi:hypothetical protein